MPAKEETTGEVDNCGDAKKDIGTIVCTAAETCTACKTGLVAATSMAAKISGAKDAV